MDKKSTIQQVNGSTVQPLTDSTTRRFNNSTGPGVVISVEGLWKQYRYGTISHETLHKDLQSWWARFRGKEDPNSLISTLQQFNASTVKSFNNSTSASDSTGEADDRFWALKDINFEVKRGEVLGIIGKNGAGKSTLLKIMSKVTTPTRGEIKIKGRVASLLEVGTGFHPELTGRENIFLNGAILGMIKEEIRRKFDEIVAFAEVEKFIDTPVKRYSSGMYVRLAFAVAAHLEPEILIVDEVLAVGDVQFQKKCLGKMGDVAKEGRTVLFVSHNMAAVRNLCNSAILLCDGQMAYEGETERAIQLYTDSGSNGGIQLPIAERSRDSGNHLTLRAKIVDFKIISEGNENPSFLNSAKPFTAIFSIATEYDNVRCGAQFIISDDVQNLILCDSASLHGVIYELKKGVNRVECQVAPLNLFAGNYKISCVLSLPNQGLIDYVPDAYPFTVNELDPNNTGFNLERRSHFGVYYVSHRWEKLE